MELFCSFGSAHERAATFQDCRRGKLPYKMLKDENFNIGTLILLCTEKKREKRPTASEILKIVEHDFHSKIVEKLRKDVAEKNSLIEVQKETIEKLQKELMELKHANMNHTV